MNRQKLKLGHEHKEVLNDLKNVIISYTPISGFIDTAKFLNKWLFRRRVAHRIGRKINKKYRMFILRQMARKYGSS